LSGEELYALLEKKLSEQLSGEELSSRRIIQRRTVREPNRLNLTDLKAIYFVNLGVIFVRWDWEM
jgi:hypothetical protein